MTLHVLIAGGGRVGTALAQVLTAGHHSVVVVDDRPDVVDRLEQQLGAAHVHGGAPTDPGALEAAGVRRVDVVAAVTATDEHNLVVTGLSRFHFGVPRTVARIVDPAHAWMYVPEMGVDVALDQAQLIARVVAEEMSLGEMMLLTKLRRGQYALVEERIPASAAAVGRRLGDLEVPPDSIVVALIRDGRPLLGDPLTVLEAGDEVLAVVHQEVAPDLAHALTDGVA